ncbi:MAG: alpha/beta fold hydrolase [Bryobacteraceae bacterium]
MSSSSSSGIVFDPAEAARQFLTPKRRADSRGISEDRIWIGGPSGRIAVTQAGTGPLVMLVHGWDGEAADLKAFVPGLLNAGYRVIAPDLPGHGFSEGALASIPACADALVALQRQFGNLHAAVAHSIGCPITILAASKGLAVETLALLAAPARYVDYAREFAKQTRLDSRQAELPIAALKNMGVDVESLSLPTIAPGLRQRALFIHSADDRVVPMADGLETAGAWPRSRLLQVDGLGHRRILRDPAVVEAVLGFVNAEP